MKKVLLLFVFTVYFFFSIDHCFAQFGWSWSIPFPNGSRLTDYYCYNEEIIFAVGWDGFFMKTTNGGINWHQKPLNSTLCMSAVCFVTENTGYVSGTNYYDGTSNNRFAYILKTTDGGDSFTQLIDLPLERINDIFFFNENTGFAISGYIYKTTNGGINWSQFTSNPYDKLNSIKFLNNNTGYVVGHSGNIYKTTNQGLNWNKQSSGNSGYGLMDVCFTDSLTGYVSEYGGTFLKTTNGGNNWTSKLLSANYRLYGIEFINSQTGFLGGGYVFKTTNGGQTWDSITSNRGSQYFKYYNPNLIFGLSEHVYAGYYYSNVVISKSTNGGYNWQNYSYTLTDDDFHRIIFTNQNTGFLSGNGGKFFRTTNSGNNWTDLSSSSYGNFRDITFLNNQTGIAIANKSILKTTNSGNNWIVKHNTYKTLDQIYKTSNCLYTSGNIIPVYPDVWYSCEILKSTNEGDSWFQVFTISEPHINIINIYFFDDNEGIMRNTNSIYKTSNGGVSWTQIASNTNDINWFKFINNTTGFSIYNNIIKKTTNQGINWNNVNINNINYSIEIRSMTFKNDNTGFITGVSWPSGGRSGDIMKTTDGGLNWNKINNLPGLPLIYSKGLNYITFLNDLTGFIAGEKGTLLKTTNGGSIVNVISYKNLTHDNYLLYQNYPNPFNPVTRIRYDLPRAGVVKLAVYDIMGREVEILVNARQAAGSYEATFDGTRFASGVYFYRLTAEGYGETKRMTLIK